jgi:hypothetical protein
MKRTFLTLLITFWDIEKINNDQGASKPCRNNRELLQKTRPILFSTIGIYMEARKVDLELFCKIPYSVDLGANRSNLGAS